MGQKAIGFLSLIPRQWPNEKKGKRFYASTDRRHSISITGSYKLSAKVNLSANWIFNAGNPNNIRAEAYHRLDFAIQFHKEKKNHKRTWEFGLFNAYNRKNPFYYFLERENDFATNMQRIVLRKKSFLPVLPSINYNIKFWKKNIYWLLLFSYLCQAVIAV